MVSLDWMFVTGGMDYIDGVIRDIVPMIMVYMWYYWSTLNGHLDMHRSMGSVRAFMVHLVGVNTIIGS